jgi:glycosyltransferase involved in cell wall biosynthesis
MKIALVARHAVPTAYALDPYSADQAAQVDGLGRALAAKGHDVVIYARKESADQPDRQALAPRLLVEYLTAGPLAPVPADQLSNYVKDIASHLSDRWRKNAPAVVHAFHWTNGLAALSAAREHPVPVVVSFGSLGAAERRHRVAGESASIRLRMESCIAKAATTVLASTSEEVDELARLGTPNAKVRMVPCGVDTKKFKPTGRIAKRNSRPQLIAIGPLAEYRGLDKIMRCLVDLPTVELTIVGGPAEDLDADHGYRTLGKLAAHLGVADRVRFAGHVSDDELPKLIRSADLLVSAARYEPVGLAAIRAMACGVPVIATSVGSYADAVIDGTSGMLVPPSRPEMLGGRLRDLLATPMRLAAFGIAACDRATSRYSWERIATETLTVYERSIGLTAPESTSAEPETDTETDTETSAPSLVTGTVATATRRSRPAERRAA